MLAADNWCVKVSDKVYGPYSSKQLRKFAHEGRLAAWSLIAPAGSRDWREARNDSTLAQFFGDPASGPAPRAFGKRDDLATPEAAPKPSQKPASAAAKKPAPSTVKAGETPNQAKRATALNEKRKPKPADKPTGPANFVVIFDVVSAAASRVEAAMLSLGPAFRLADNVWTVNCELTAIGVRNAIAPYLRTSESIFVVDATRGRTSWQNYAAPIHAKISESFAAKLSAAS